MAFLILPWPFFIMFEASSRVLYTAYKSHKLKTKGVSFLYSLTVLKRKQSTSPSSSETIYNFLGVV